MSRFKFTVEVVSCNFPDVCIVRRPSGRYGIRHSKTGRWASRIFLDNNEMLEWALEDSHAEKYLFTFDTFEEAMQMIRRAWGGEHD